MKRLILALLACAALLPSLVSAEQVQNLYEVQVPVVSQGEEARRAGVIAALSAVLVKLSGRSDIHREPGLSAALAAPDRYVQQFRYVAPPPESAGAGLSMWVRFDGRALEQLLRSKHLPVWSATRPATLVWVGTEERGQRALIGAGEAGPVAAAVQAAGDRRGLPLRLPLMDLEDQSRVRAADLWGGFGETILSASARYRAPVILMGTLSRSGDNQWRGRWTLYRDGAMVRRWDADGALPNVVDAGIDVTADDLARTYAGAGTEAEGGLVALRVGGVRTLDDNVRVSNYLRSLSGVTSAQPVEIAGDQVLFQVSLEGSAEAFARAIGLGETLAPVQNPADPSAELSYRLVQ